MISQRELHVQGTSKRMLFKPFHRIQGMGKSGDISPISGLFASFPPDASLDLDTSPEHPHAAWTAKIWLRQTGFEDRMTERLLWR